MIPCDKKIYILIAGLSITLASFTCVSANDLYKKTRTKQLSKHSDCYNYYEEKRNRVKEGSKSLGIDARKLEQKCRKIQNWVEIDNSKVGNVAVSATKRFKSLNPYKNRKDKDPDRNIGVIVDSNTVHKVENHVIVKKSKVENALLGADVNSGIIVKGKKIHGKEYQNNVTVEKSRVGGAVGIFD